MRPFRVVALFLVLFAAVALSGCSKEEAPQHDEHGTAESVPHATEYHCPMKCEGEKTYPEAGKCPDCGMALKPVGG